jgi:uncharacterized protein (TIGR00661 family)
MNHKPNILYSIQCTGNGHLTRSKQVIQTLLNNYSDRIGKLDVCLSGEFSQVSTEDLNVQFKYKGLGLDTSNGGLSIWNTIKNTNFRKFFRAVNDMDLKDYDIIISDFEPVTCWAAMLRGRKVLGVGNHYKFLSNRNFLNNINPNFFSNKMVVRSVCPVNRYIAFDYLKEGPNEFFPIIRDSIRKVDLKQDDFYIVYLSSIDIDKQIKFFNLFPNEKFYIYHNKIEKAYDYENCNLRPIDKVQFTEKLIRCKGVICHTGFQTTSECLYLGKKMVVIPIKKQIEQIYNTNILKKMGVLAADNLEIPIFNKFFENDYSVKLNYQDEMGIVCEEILKFRS